MPGSDHRSVRCASATTGLIRAVLAKWGATGRTRNPAEYAVSGLDDPLLWWRALPDDG